LLVATGLSRQYRIGIKIGVVVLAAGFSPTRLSADSVPESGVSGPALFQEHKFEQATQAFEADLKAGTNQVQALIYLGRIAFEGNHLGEAARFFERATDLATNNSMAYLWLGRAYGVQARELGPPRGIGPARKAKNALEKSVSLGPDNLEARVDLATFYREAPGIVGGNSHAAAMQADEIARRDPYLGALVRGDLLLSQQQFAEAERAYQSATSLKRDRTDAYYRLGILYERTKQYDKAFSAFEDVLRMNSTDKPAQYQIGRTADLSGQQLDRGEEALKLYLQCQPFYIMPKLTSAHRHLGNIYLRRGRPDAAREQYQACLALDPNDKQAGAALKKVDAATAGTKN
jgi:tetratricopeptide (TPR) repeat protein